MDIVKLKKLLAEGNPDKQLDNIIENLSESEPAIVAKKQLNLSDTNDKMGDKIELKIRSLTGERDLKELSPEEVIELKELQAELKILKNRENNHKTDAFRNLKKAREENADPLSGVSEGANNVNSELNKEIKKNINIKEEDLMKKEQKAIFEQSMADIFKMLKEGDDEMTEEELMVGKVPAVESPEVEPGQEVIQAEEPVLEPELQANDADVAIAKPEMESVVNIQTDVQPEVSLTDNSIKIEIPIAAGESVVDEVSAEEADALQEAFRTIYRILGSNMLMENEDSIEIPEDAKADLKTENGKLVIEIPLENPTEEISQDSADALQEAISVISFLLKEELTPEEENGVRKLLQSKEQEYGVDFNGNGTVEPAEHPRIEDEDIELAHSMISEPQETVQMPTNVQADVTVNPDSIVIELPLIDNIVDSIEGDEIIQEAFKFIYSVFKSSNLNEAESVEVPESAEADVTVKDGKLVIEIPIENPKEEVDMEEALALQEAFDYISFALNENKKLKNTVKGLGGAALGGAAGGGAVLAADAARLASKEALIRANWLKAFNQVKDGLTNVPAAATPEYVTGLVQQGLAALGMPATADAAVAAAGLGTSLISKLGTAAAPFIDAAGTALAPVSTALAPVTSALTSAAGSASTALSSFGTAAAPVIAAASPFLLPGAAALGAGALGYGIASGKLPKFLNKKLGITKAGKLYKEREKIDTETFNKNIESQYKKKVDAQQEFLNKKAELEADSSIKDAGKGLTLGSKVLSSIPLFNKLGNVKMFQNKDIQDRIAKRSNDVVAKYNNTPAGKKELSDNNLVFDPNTKIVSYKNWETLTPDQKNAAVSKKLEITGQLADAGDYSSAVSAIKTDQQAAKQKRKTDIEAAKQKEVAAVKAADINIKKDKALMKDKDFDEARYQTAKATARMNEGFDFDVDSAYAVLKNTPFSEQEKLNIITEAYNDLYFVSLRKNLQESGYSFSQKGISLFLESKGVDISMEEKDGLMKSLNSESVVKDFEEHYQSKRHSDIKSEEMTNKDMNYGKSSTEVTPPIIQESEKAKKPHTEELNHGGSDTIDSTGKLATDKEASEKEEKLTVKAEPTDVTIKEAAKYRSLKEAFLLESNYFETDSTSIISAGNKKDKLVSQLGLLVARDVQDPLYEELIRATAVSKRLQEELQSKYKAVALKKAGELLESKLKKSDNSQASSLDFLTALYEETLQEGFGKWAKGKILMMVVGLIPEPKLDEIIMKAKVKALQIGKSQAEKMEIGRLFKQATGSKDAKIKFIKRLIKEAPENQQANADEKLSKLVMSLKNKTEEQQKEGKPLQESIQTVINEGFWSEVGKAIMASSPLSMVVGILAGLAVAGIVALVTKLVKDLIKDQYELDY